jgi:hypothetical protein
VLDRCVCVCVCVTEMKMYTFVDIQPLYSATEEINAHTGGWRAITGQGVLAKMGRISKRERCCFS